MTRPVAEIQKNLEEVRSSLKSAPSLYRTQVLVESHKDLEAELSCALKMSPTLKAVKAALLALFAFEAKAYAGLTSPDQKLNAEAMVQVSEDMDLLLNNLLIELGDVKGLEAFMEAMETVKKQYELGHDFRRLEALRVLNNLMAEQK